MAPLNVETAQTTSEIKHLRPPAGPEWLRHRELLRGPFWQRIPAYHDVSEETFLDHMWQARGSITRIEKLLAAVEGIVSEEFVEDARAGFRSAPMSVRVTPYLLALIDWDHPYDDPLRRQFLPLASQMLPDHPKLGLDSLGEVADSPVPGFTHRYPDKGLFLALDTCPVYCRYCTRSYAVGIDTEGVEKIQLKVSRERWEKMYQYIRERPELEDIVISGGDVYNLRAAHITEIGEALLAIPHVRRMRFATKGPAIAPQKILSDIEWTDALTRVVEQGRKLHKDVVLHTHFSHPNEITGITQDAMDLLFERGITVRNQAVLQRGVNDTIEAMRALSKSLSHLNVHPYYVFVHDLVKGVEDLRTTVQTAVDLEKNLRGSTAGFNTPTFVVDAPAGGGKRDAHSYEYYNRVTGVSAYTAPIVKPGRLFLYFDPVDQLPPEGQARWADPAEHDAIVEEAVAGARARATAPVV